MPIETSTARSLWHLVPKPLRTAGWSAVAAWNRRRILSGRAHEPAVAKALARLTRPDDHCADVGANYGLLTVILARSCGPTGRVFAFEPHPKNVLTIGQTVSRYGLSGHVTIEATAIADGATDYVSLHAGRERHDSEWNIVGHDSNGQPTPAELRVPAVSLDRYFANAERLNVIKIDVEGAESLVLAGAAEVIRRFKPSLLIEVHSLANWRACAQLADQSYAVFDLEGRPLNPLADLFPPHIVLLPAGRSF
jgi:FkbM family methyltransferase